MISCPDVCISGGINVVVGHSSIGTMVFFIALIISVPALCCVVTQFATNLAGDLLATRVA
jgi:hypothetical protein